MVCWLTKRMALRSLRAEKSEHLGPGENKIGFYYEYLKLIKMAINRVHRHPNYSDMVGGTRCLKRD